VARSAHEARELGFLREGDRITMNRDRVLADARALALELADGYRPPDPVELPLPGRSGHAALMLAVDGLVLRGAASAHDRLVASHLATVLTGGPDADPLRPTTEQTLRDLERAAFLALARTEPTLQRMEHILATGRPLRN
jgi:3-hydroxyacyl-CoA dehydrogenase